MYDGSSIRDGRELRGCYESRQKNKSEPLRLSSGASDSLFEEVAAEAAAELRGEFDTKHLTWVCDHEEQGHAIRRAIAHRDFATARMLYEQKQNHNPEARNLLSAFSEDQLATLVNSYCPDAGPRGPDRPQGSDRHDHDRPDRPRN